MGLLKTPSVSFLTPLDTEKGHRRAIVTFAYDFFDEAVSAFSQGPYGQTGNLYTLNMSELNNQNNLPEMKSMRVSALFLPPQGSPIDGDGALGIYNAQTSDFVLLGNPGIEGTTLDTSSPPPANILNTCFPFSVQPNGTVTFSKSISAAAAPPYTTRGQIFVSLFSWDVPPYTVLGQSTINGLVA